MMFLGVCSYLVSVFKFYADDKYHFHGYTNLATTAAATTAATTTAGTTNTASSATAVAIPNTTRVIDVINWAEEFY